MAILVQHTIINAPLPVVFDLSRSIDMHLISTAGTGERVIAGVASGLIQQGQTVTWQARHLLKTRRFKSFISHMEPYRHFRDEMLEGDFKYFCHDHYFEQKQNAVIVTDKLMMQAPYGLLGKIATSLFLKTYLLQFLQKRNAQIKQFAEDGRWKKILNQNDYQP